MAKQQVEVAPGRWKPSHRCNPAEHLEVVRILREKAELWRHCASLVERIAKHPRFPDDDVILPAVVESARELLAQRTIALSRLKAEVRDLERTLAELGARDER